MFVNESINQGERSLGFQAEAESETSSDSPPSLATTESESESDNSDSGHSDTGTFTPSIIKVMGERQGLKGVNTRVFNKVSYGFTEDMNSWR